MSRKLCVVMAITAFLSLDFVAVQSTEAQLLRRIMGRRSNNCCCQANCGTNDCCTSNCATGDCGTAVASYAEPTASYVEPAASYVEPVSYAAPVTMEYQAAPVNYTEAPSEAGCGCGGEVGYEPTPAMPMIGAPVDVTPATYTSGCIGCEGMTQVAPVSTISYAAPVSSVGYAAPVMNGGGCGCAAGADCGCGPDCGCGGAVSTGYAQGQIMQAGYVDGGMGYTNGGYIEGDMGYVEGGYADGGQVIGAPCEGGGCGGGIVTEGIIYEGAVESVPVEAPAIETEEATDTPPAAPSEDEATEEVESENKEA